MDNFLLLNFSLAVRAGNLVGANSLSSAHNIQLDYASRQKLNKLFDDAVVDITKNIENTITETAKPVIEEIQKITKTKKEVEQKITNIIGSKETTDIAQVLNIKNISIEHLELVRKLKKQFAEKELKEIFPFALQIQNYAQKFETFDLQKEIFKNVFPPKEQLQKFLDFYKSIDEISQKLENANEIVQAALKSKIWQNDFYKYTEVLKNQTKEKVERNIYEICQKFVSEVSSLEKRAKQYSVTIPEIASKEYYQLIKRLDIYESFISSKYPLANLEDFQNSAMLAVHEQTQKTQYQRYFNRFPHKITEQVTNIFTETKDQAEKKITNTINQFLQNGSNEYKKLTESIVKITKIISDITAQKKVLENKIKLISYDVYGAVMEDSQLHLAAASNIFSFKSQIENTLHFIKPYQGGFREISGGIATPTNRIAYLAETLQILYRETRLSFLSSVVVEKEPNAQKFLDKINSLVAEFRNTNNLFSGKYPIAKNFQFGNLEELLTKQAEQDKETSRKHFLFRIFLAMPQYKEHVEFLRQHVLQNAQLPAEISSYIEQQFVSAFGASKQEPEKLRKKIKEIQKQFSLPMDGILGNNISFIKKEAGDFFKNQIKSLNLKDFNTASLKTKPLPEAYIYNFKKAMDVFSRIEQKPEFKPLEINGFYFDFANNKNQSTEQTTKIIKKFQDEMQLPTTGLLDEATLTVLSRKLSAGLANSNQDAKQKYNELKQLANQAQSKIDTLNLQKRGILDTLNRYNQRIKNEVRRIKPLVITDKADASGLYREGKHNFSEKEKFTLVGKNHTEQFYNTLEKHAGQFFYKTFDQKKNLYSEHIKNTDTKLSDIEFVFENDKFKETKEKIKITESDGSLLDNLRFAFEQYWQEQQEIENIKELQKHYQALQKQQKSLESDLAVQQNNVYGYTREFLVRKYFYSHSINLSNMFSNYNVIYNGFINLTYRDFKTHSKILHHTERCSWRYFRYSHSLKRFFKKYSESNTSGMDYGGDYDETCIFEFVDISGFAQYIQAQKNAAKPYHNKVVEITNKIKSLEPDKIKSVLENKEKFQEQISQIERNIQINLVPQYYRALQAVKNQIQKIQKIELTRESLESAIEQVENNLKSIEAQIKQQTALLLNKSNINKSLLDHRNILQEVQFKKDELEKAQLNLQRIILTLAELESQKKSLEDSLSRIKTNLTNKIMTSSDVVTNLINLASTIPQITESIIPQTAIDNFKKQGDGFFQKAKENFVKISAQADTIIRAGSAAIMDFKKAMIGADSKIKEAANRLQLWFVSEARKVAEYESQLKIELEKPENIKAIKDTIEREHITPIASALAQAVTVTRKKGV